MVLVTFAGPKPEKNEGLKSGLHLVYGDMVNKIVLSLAQPGGWACMGRDFT